MIEQSALSPRRLLGVLFTLWLVIFVSSSQFLLVAPVLPRIGEEMRVSDALLGTLVTSYAVAVGVFALIAGPISDRVGRRSVLLAGTALQTLALVAHGLAWDFPSLLALRSLSGMASGVLAGASIAYVGDALPYNRRGYAIGWIMSGMAFGQILGVPLGTVFASWWGFRAPFVVLGGVMAVAVVCTALVLTPVKLPVRRERLTLVGAIRDYEALLRRPDIAALNAASAVMMLGVSLFIVYMPIWLEREHGATPGGVAVLFLFGGIASALAGPFAGGLSDRVGRKGLVVAASFSLSLLMVMTAYLPSLWAVDLVFFLVMISASMRMSPLQALLTGLVGDDRRGSLLSLNMAVGQVGFALGAGLSGTVYAGWGFAGNAWIAGLTALTVAVIVQRFAIEPHPELEAAREDEPVLDAR